YKSFDDVYKETFNEWNEELSKILVEGGSYQDKVIFYSALYHTLIHPNTLNDINGEYPKIKRTKVGRTNDTRYTVFSLWDTYRNMHPLTSLVYPKQQSDMIKSMLQMYDENGWLPKWELNSTETFTMVGDPASIVIADACLKGIQDFDIYKAYHAMLKGADQIEENPLRPGLKEYIQKGYLSTNYHGSVSTTEEYNVSDYAIALMAKALGEKEDYKRFYKRSLSYQKLYDKDLKLLRPRTPDGKWYEPFDPNAGANFQENVGFIEGNAWQYAFMVPHDIKGLIKLMGGDKVFSEQLQKVFDIKQFDMANEPDIAYPYLFNYVKGEEWKSQEMVKKLVREYFKNEPKGLPGNDDTGTMSAWLVYSMMGIYPISPGDPIYTITTPMFDKVTIKLDSRYYKKDNVVIERVMNTDGKIKEIQLNGKTLNSFFMNHDDFVNGTTLKVIQE
ncbi:MAG: glycoside hydrolase family 92 protein, partial [Flavobacterium sp.]|uniref:glycoside hydrolase family 92 protein n=2 Tax=Flavobacterium TaxID=237 RepID=UPI002FC5D628